MLPTVVKSKAKPSGHGTAWTAADNELLSSLAGDLPWPMVLAAFNRQRPHRTATALLRQAERCGIPRDCVGQYITAGLIVELANTNYTAVSRWIKNGINGDRLPARRFGNGRSFPYWIRRRDLRQFAKRHPELLGGLAEPELVQLLDSEPLAAEIVAMELPPSRRRAAAVECVETGRRYPSITAAAKSAYVTKQRMRAAIATGERANGYHWRRVSK